MPDRWFTCVVGVVVDVADPEGLHRIRCLIPDISEDIVHDEWIAPLLPWVGDDGYGPANLPAVNSEVMLFGCKGQKYDLFYLSRYNETHRPPPEFADGSRGCKCDTVLRLLCDLLIQVKSLARVEVDAPDVLLQSGGAVSVHGQGAKVAFLGAAPIARRALPPDASNLPTVIALANATKALLKDYGLAD